MILKNTLLPLFFLLMPAILLGYSIPDSLNQKLRSVEGEERLQVWKEWYKDFIAANDETWIEAIEKACWDAQNILSPKEAETWCFNLKLGLSTSLINAGIKEKGVKILQDLQPLADSLANLNDGVHVFKVKWLRAFGRLHYMNVDNDEAFEYYNQALTMSRALKDTLYEFKSLRSLGLVKYVGNFYDEAEDYYDQARELSPNIDLSRRDKVMFNFHSALLYMAKEELERADLSYREILPDLDQVNLSVALQIQLYYANNLCQLGKTSQAIAYYNKLQPQIEEEGGLNTKITFAAKYSDCLVLKGDTKNAMIMNQEFRDLMQEEFLQRRNSELLEWKTKYETAEKDAKIQILEQEKDLGEAKAKNRLALISIAALFGIGILSFFLMQNKNRRRQLRLSLEKDKAIAENRDRLFSSITHDIRTPLALMLAPLERADEKSTEKPVKEDIQLARRHGKRLLELFNQILDWNKAEAKAMSINKQIGQLDISLDTMCKRYEHQAFESGVDFQKEVNVSSKQYLMDYDKLDKIVSNLVGNSIKFTETGKSVILKVAVSKAYGLEKLNIQVIDEGPGIADEEQKQLFDRYFQGKAGKEIGGSGIGLALVKELMDMLKGTIQLKSSLGEGTSFELNFPLEAVDVPYLVVAKQKDENSGEEIEKPLVLLIEDEPDLLKFLHSSLLDHYEVEVANTTEVGLSIGVSRIPDIIICDWMLPDHNGGWLCREIKKNSLTAHIPVLILTAQSDEDTRSEAFESGAIALMGKPFTLSTLKQQLKTILDQQGKTQKAWQNKLGPEAITDSESASVDPFVQKVTELIKENMSDEYYSVEKMADELLISRVQLFRKMRSLTGKSPSILLKEFRMEKARTLLKQPGQSIGEIAYAVGFSDPSYFSKVYKKHFKTSPTQDQAS